MAYVDLTRVALSPTDPAPKVDVSRIAFTSVPLVAGVRAEVARLSLIGTAPSEVRVEVARIALVSGYVGPRLWNGTEWIDTHTYVWDGTEWIPG